MAGKSNKGVNIGVGLDTSGIASGVQQVQGQMKQLNAEVRGMVDQLKGTTQEAAQGFKKVGDSSGIAGAAVMSFNGIIQDSNYGMRGIANNLQQLGMMFGVLVSQTGSVRLAMIELRTAIMGPLGILLAFTTFITWLERQEIQSQKAASETKKLKVETDKLGKEFANQSSQAMVLFGSLNKLVTENGSLSDIKKTAQEINDKYNTSLNTEKVTLDDLNKAYGDVLQSIKLNIAIKSQQASLEKAIEGETKANKKLNEIFNERLKISNQIAKGEINQDTGLEKIAELNKESEAYNKNLEGHQKNQNIALQNAISLTGQLNDLGLEKQGKIGRIEVDTSSLKDIQNDFKLHEEGIKDVFKNMQDVVSEGGDLMSFDGKLLGVKFGAGVTDGLDQLMTTLPEKMSTVVKAIVEPIDEINMRLNAMVKQMIVSSVSGFLGAVGESIGGGKDAIKQFGQDFLGEFGGFLQQVGAMILTYGFAMEAFKSAFKDPITTIAAGAALIVIGGAIKGAHEKKFGKSAGGGGGVSGGYGGGSGSYNSQLQDNIIYSRLDGRDLVLSNQRTGYSNGR